MTDLERLKRLTIAGDKDAARRLVALSERRADNDALVLASLTLGDAERVIERMVKAWEGKDWSQTSQLAQQMGLTFDAAIARAIDKKLKGTSRLYGTSLCLTRNEILRLLFEARVSYLGIAWKSAGHGGWDRRSQVCLVARRRTRTMGPHLALRLGWSDAREATPGTVWSYHLSPWFKDVEKNRKRVELWLRGTRSLMIPFAVGSEVLKSLEEELSQPLHHLEKLLAVEPSESAFKLVLKHIDRWSGQDAAEALQLATTELESWPDSCRVAGKAWLRRAAELSFQPHLGLVRTLELKDVQTEHLNTLSERVRGAHLTHLRLYGERRTTVRSERRKAFIRAVQSTAVSGLDGLSVKNLTHYAGALAAVLSSPTLAGLSALRLDNLKPVGGSLGEVTVKRLKSLMLSNVLRDAELLVHLLDELPELQSFEMWQRDFPITASVGKALAAMPALRTLRLRGCVLQGEGIKALSTATTLEELVLQQLRAPKSKGRGVSSLCEGLSNCAALSSLHTLSLIGELFESGSDGLERLLHSSHLQRAPLRALDLKHIAISEVSAELLHTHFGGLERLIVSPGTLPRTWRDALQKRLAPGALRISDRESAVDWNWEGPRTWS